MQLGIAWPEVYELSFAVLHAWCRCEQAPSPRGDDAGDETTTAWVNKRRCALMEGCAALMLLCSVAGHSQQHSLHLVCAQAGRASCGSCNPRQLSHTHAGPPARGGASALLTLQFTRPAPSTNLINKKNTSKINSSPRAESDLQVWSQYYEWFKSYGLR